MEYNDVLLDMALKKWPGTGLMYWDVIGSATSTINYRFLLYSQFKSKKITST